jgi:hypothetical protein
MLILTFPLQLDTQLVFLKVLKIVKYELNKGEYHGLQGYPESAPDQF